MTVPVTMQIQPDTKSQSFSKSDYTMSFFIPFKHQKDAPAPSAEDVQLTVVQPFCAYVRAYGGRSNITRIEENYKALEEDLKTNGLGDDFRTDMIYSAGYNDPKSPKQHNEIWLVSKRQTPAPLPENKKEQSALGKFFGKIFGKVTSINFPSIAKKIMSKLPFNKPEAESPEPSTETPVNKWSPTFCGSNDCPLFYTKLNTTDYTLRCYPNRHRWVSTTVTGKPLIELLPDFGLKKGWSWNEYFSSFVRKWYRNRGFLLMNLSRAKPARKFPTKRITDYLPLPHVLLEQSLPLQFVVWKVR